MKQAPFVFWFFILLSFTFGVVRGFAQAAARLSLSNACKLDASLPSFAVETGKSHSGVEDLIRAIRSRSTSSDVPVYHFGSNIQTVAAVVGEDRRRYLLYNPALFEAGLPENDTLRILHFLMLAHALGHHFCEHPLDQPPTADDEWEADFFAGFASYFSLSLENKASLEAYLDLPVFKSAVRHRDAILSGFEKAEVALLHADGFDFSTPKSIQRLETSLPEFQWPPPNNSAEADLHLYFKDCHKISGIDDKLKRVLKEAGYARWRYFAIPGGFAVVTQLEQFDADGKPKKGDNRWKLQPKRFDEFSFSNYLKALLTTEPGYFRVLVFLVTDQPVYSTAGHVVSREVTQAWLQEGADILSKQIAEQKAEYVKVRGWVYEFLTPESTRKATFNPQSHLSGEKHLEGAGIMAGLRK